MDVLLWVFASPPYSIDVSGSSVQSESSTDTSPKLIAVICFLGVALIVLLAIMCIECKRNKKYKKAVPIRLGVVNSDEHDNNQDATRTDRVELWMDENVASLVTLSDQLNNNNEKITTSSNNIGVHKLNIEKHGKNNKAEAMTSNIRVDQLNINKRGKNFLEAKATTSDVGVDQLNINKCGNSDKNKEEASTSYVKVDRLNINKRGKNHKKEAKATTSNIDEHDKNGKKEAEVTTSNIRVDKLNIDKHVKNDRKEARATTSDVRIDKLNIDKNDIKKANASTSNVRVDKLNTDMRGKNDKKETKTTDSDFRVNKLNIEEHEKNTNKKKAKATTPSDVKYDKNDKEEATISDLEFDEDKLNINEHEKRKLKKSHSEKVEQLIQKVDEQKPRRYTVEDLKASTENNKKWLGAGSYGDVYKGKSPDGVDIAVKVLKNLNTRKDPEKLAAEQFMAEVQSIYNTHHINVIRLFGFCYEDEKVDNSNPMIALVYEYMENGSLDKYLSGKKDELEFEKLYDIAIGTAKGLAYLHEECQQKIIHFDIKPENILLDSKFTPKVCDFGLAKLCNRDDTHISLLSDQKGGTPGYIAPEVIQSNQLTNKCDVYSFGMVLFKMVEVKTKNKNNNNNKSLSDWFPICVRDAAFKNKLEVLIGRDCDFSNEHEDKAIRACEVGLLCVQQLPSSRPLMSEVVRMLEGADPINLTQSWPFQNLKPLPTRK